MTQKGEDAPQQVEFRVLVDAERAAAFAKPFAELAMEHGGTVVSSQPEPEVVEVLPAVANAEQAYFRKDMTTEIYEEYPTKIVPVVTRDDLKHFAETHNFASTVPSHLFNTINRVLRDRRCLQNVTKDEFLVAGPLVNRPTDSEPTRPLVVDGLRISHIAQLESELSGHIDEISGYGYQSRDLLSQFVAELFNPDQVPTVD